MECELTSLLVLLVVGGIGFGLGWLAHQAMILTKLASNPDEVIAILQSISQSDWESKQKELNKALKNQPIEVKLVHAENGWLAYNSQGEFLAQGNSRDETIASIEAKFPNKTLIY